MKSKKKSWLVLIVVVLMIAACGYVSAYGYGKDHIGTAKNIKLGLDLAGRCLAGKGHAEDRRP